MRIATVRVVVGVLASAVVAALLVACGPDQGTSKSPSATPSLRAPSADARTSAEQAAVTAYRGMWAAFVSAGRVADPKHPDLARYAADDALRALVAAIESNKKDRLIAKGDIVANPRVTELTPANAPQQASVRDCLDTTNASLVKADGSPYQDTPGGRRIVTATVKKLGATWKVISFVPLEVGSC